MRVSGMQDDRYFTHFEVARVMTLAAYKLEKAQSCKNDNICVNILGCIIYFHINSRGSKTRNLGLGAAGFSFPVNFFKDNSWNEKPELMIQVIEFN